MTMVILTGITTGNVLAATSSTLTANISLDQNQTLGKDIAIVSGTGKNSVSQIVGVSGTTPNIITVYPDFQETPDASSTYMICDNQYPVVADYIAYYDKFRSAGLSRPQKFFSSGNEDYDEFIFDCPPDANYTYVCRMRYFVNIMTLDLSSNLMETLYQKFRNFWIQGVKMQALMDNDDDGAPASQADKMSKLQQIIVSQQYGTDIHTLRQHVEDYQ